MGIRTVELFAGVGGFRLGLEATNQPFDTVWFNQWEPGSRAQHAWNRYVQKFCVERGEPIPELSNSDICLVDESRVPEHDFLVGGFPCQDYSVATTLDKAGGLRGKKGVLWWEIERIVSEQKPKYLLLENVDRLLRSPADQRGRDFAILLWGLNKLGYRVEWRVINAADYGNAQRRRRTFIFAAHKSSGIGKHLAKKCEDIDYLYSTGFFAQEFPVHHLQLVTSPTFHPLGSNLQDVSDKFQFMFQNAGVMVNGKFATRRVDPAGHGPTFLLNHLQKHGVPESYFLDMARYKDWETAKGPKRDKRTAKSGFQYYYTEGGMQFPDLRNAPARTVLTSEANRTPNRSTHVVKDVESERPRFLMPVEVERVMGFPDDWTLGLPERWRYFTMGNALVVPVVTQIGNRLAEWIKTHETKDEVERLLGKQQAKPIAALQGAVRRRGAKAVRRKRPAK